METAPSGGGAPSSYADSIESLSPRSRGAESWDEPFTAAPTAAAAATPKLRLMCSYGGQIVPRPHDRSLCYLGGETRIVAVDRHTTLADLHARLSRSLLGGRPFSLKYQLPSEDLDSLISVSTDEDLDNMVDEYDRLAGKPARLRLFLFPAKPEPPAPPSLLDDSKSETWFVDALNSAMLAGGGGAGSASSSVNCLLGLDDSSKPSPGGAGDDGLPPESENEAELPRRDSSGKLGGSGSRRGGQDVPSAPESPMLGTASSFGSASSAPSLSHLPPIRVRAADRGPDLGAGLEQHFAQMNMSDLQHQQQHVEMESFNPVPQHYSPAPTTAAIPSNISTTEKPIPSSRVFTSDDDRSDHGDAQRSSPQGPQQQHQQPQPQQQQKPNFDGRALPGDAASRPVYYQEKPPPFSDPKQEPPQYDPSFRLQMQMTEKGAYFQPPPPPPELLQPQQQQTTHQFMQASPHLLHHHASGSVLPMNPYYQVPIHHQQQLPQAAHPYNQQIPMYSLPLQQNSAYSLPVTPPLGDAPVAASNPSAAKPTVPLPNAALHSGVAPPPKPELAANVYRTGVGAAATAPSFAQQLQPAQFIHFADPSHQYVGYHSMPPHRPQPPAAMQAAGFGYEYADVARPQQVYYTQAAPTALPPQYQAVSSGAVISEAPPADPKQARAS